MIFVTSGSMLPFDRLFRAVDSAVESGLLTEPVFAQIGESRYLPQRCEYVRFLDKSVFDDRVKNASMIIAHAGIGIIMEALKTNTPLLVMPRLARLGEHVNDHQESTAAKFESLGHILSFTEDTLPQRLKDLETFSPRPRNPNVQGVSNRIAEYLESLNPSR